ncbi:MAG: DEAD/DEAH box helicase [Magnetococcales bacterium]|nr:DEAD/DEAH box helicase [Magnetococcales bacterium]
MSDFADLPLIPLLHTTLRNIGYKEPTPIQSQAIPPLLEGADLLGIAQTGTGKTAAFALPIINYLSHQKRRIGPRLVRVLILTPTRELASQIDASFAELSRGMKLYRCVVFGGVSQNPQVRTLSRGVDVLVATPGRLLDLMNQGYVRLDQLDTFVLDEADRMLDMGFINDIKKIIKTLPKKRQTLLFSATMPENIEELASGLLTNPVKVEVTPQATTVDKIKQTILYVDKVNKRKLLHHLIEKNNIQRALVFTRTKHAANKVAEELDKNGVRTTAIHGNKSQGAREKALLQFRQGQVRVLVATDIAARGIDVKEITHVINFDLPNEPENYVHRIGRTARAGLEGLALSFCDSGERFYLREIQRAIRMNIEVDPEHPFHSSSAENAPYIKPKPNGGGGGGKQRSNSRRGSGGPRSGGGQASGGGQRSGGGGKRSGSGGQHSSSGGQPGDEQQKSSREQKPRSSKGRKHNSTSVEQQQRGKSNSNSSKSGNRSFRGKAGEQNSAEGGNRSPKSGRGATVGSNRSSPGNKRGGKPKINRGNRGNS